MKTNYLAFVSIIFLIFIHSNSHGQTTCAGAAPFCTSTGVTFPAGVNNGTAPAGPNYGCLGSQLVWRATHCYESTFCHQHTL
jgi:hypothetical protein